MLHVGLGRHWRMKAGGMSRDELMDRLAGRNIETRPFFHPLHHMPLYGAEKQKFPHSDRLARQGISLPSGHKLTEADIERVKEALAFRG